MITQSVFRFTPNRWDALANYLAEDLVNQVCDQVVETASEDCQLMLWVRDLLRHRGSRSDAWQLLAAGNAVWDRANSLERPNPREPLAHYDLSARGSYQSRHEAGRVAALKAAAYSAYAMAALNFGNSAGVHHAARLIEDAIEASAAAAAASTAAILGEKLEAALDPVED